MRNVPCAGFGFWKKLVFSALRLFQARTVLFIGQLVCYTEAILERNVNKKGVAVMMDYRLQVVNGHIEVYNPNGGFEFSADTMQEALEELKEYFAA